MTVGRPPSAMAGMTEKNMQQTELKARTVDFKPGERNVFFHLLTGCNLSCRHCYINKDQHGSGVVFRETMRQWLALFADPDKNTNVIFLGGEPTMHPDLAFGVKTAQELGYQSVTVDTNGYLFHDFLEHVTPEQLDFLSFSLDGPSPEVNDPIRGQGVFEVCSGNLQKAVAAGFNVSLIYTVSRKNIGSLHEMPALLARWGVKRFFIQVIGLRGNTAKDASSAWQLTPEEWLVKVPEVAALAAGLGLHVIYPKVFLDRSETFQCAGLVAENFFLFPNGRVYRCPLCEDFAIHAMRIEDGKLIRNIGITEENLFTLNIPEGCVMAKLLQPDNIAYDAGGNPLHRISCCLLKQELV